MEPPTESQNCHVDFVPPGLCVNDYDGIADVYDDVMGADCAEIICDELFKTALPFLPKDRRLRYVDLACGSGAVLTRVLRRTGAEAFAVDLSARQVAHARAKLRHDRLSATVVVGNVSHWQPPSECDLVTMNLDALNHLRDLADWSAIFRKVHGAIRQGGIFWLDVNTPRRILEDWRHPEVIIKERLTYVQCPIGEPENGSVVRRRILMQVFAEQGEVLRRYYALIEQTTIPTDQVLTMLRAAGFATVTAVSRCSNASERHIFMKNRQFISASKGSGRRLRCA